MLRVGAFFLLQCFLSTSSPNQYSQFRGALLASIPGSVELSEPAFLVPWSFPWGWLPRLLGWGPGGLPFLRVDPSPPQMQREQAQGLGLLGLLVGGPRMGRDKQPQVPLARPVHHPDIARAGRSPQLGNLRCVCVR